MVKEQKVQNIQVGFVISICLIGYVYWASIEGIHITLADALLVGLFNSLLVFLFWFYLLKSKASISPTQLIIGAVIFRLVAVFGNPILEDDYFRYLLDACVFAQYGSPYGISPDSLFVSNQLTPACQILLNHVNNPTYATIYAPVLQYIFLLAYSISPANITVLQLICSVFDIGIIILLLKMAKANYVLLYAWNPLVIKEAVFTAHPDVVTIFFVLCAMHLLRRKFFMVCAMSMALALASKVFVIVLIPFMLIKIQLRYWILCALSLLLLYLPFLLTSQTDFKVLGQFVQQWSFNASLFFLLDAIFYQPLSRYISLVLYGAIWLYFFSKFINRGRLNELFRPDLIIGILLLISPVVNPWYLLWLLPFACIYPSHWAWVASVSFWFSYIIGLHLADYSIGPYQQPLWGWLLVYLPIFIAVIWCFKDQLTRNKY